MVHRAKICILVHAVLPRPKVCPPSCLSFWGGNGDINRHSAAHTTFSVHALDWISFPFFFALFFPNRRGRPPRSGSNCASAYARNRSLPSEKFQA